MKKTEIKKTENLKQFKTIWGNRTVNPLHVASLVKSIQDNGMLVTPIVVNESYEVIDGQHRLQAAKEINSFIYYVVADGYGIDEVHNLNSIQRNWSKLDFVNAYAQAGIESYIILKEFTIDHPAYSLGACQTLLSGGTNRGASSPKLNKSGKVTAMVQVFKEGTWLCGDVELAEDWINKIDSLAPYFSNYSAAGFVIAITRLLPNDKFNFNDFLKNVKAQPGALRACPTRASYIELIEEIYNYRRRVKINLRYS